MGNVCGNQNIFRQRPHRTSIQSLQPTKNYQDGCQLLFKIETWPNVILPDLRSNDRMVSQNFLVNTSGQMIVYKEGQINFKPFQKNSNIIQKLNNSVNSDRNRLQVKIQKGLTAFEITYNSEYIYELIRQPRELKQGQKILLGGTQYQFVKFVQNPDHVTQHIKSLSHIQKSRSSIPSQQPQSSLIVKTHQYLKSFSSFSNINDQNDKPTCRICLGEMISRQNPLISPCDCIGSVKYFHVNCWTEWAVTSQISKEGMYIGNVKKETCQICKKSLISSQYYRHTVAALLSSTHKIKPPFIVLQGLKALQNYPYYRSMKLNYVILSFSQKSKYKIGRAQDIDVRLTIDNSISRKNTSLMLKDDKIYIKDIDSKHGTYVRASQKIQICNDIQKSYLYMNNLITLKIQ